MSPRWIVAIILFLIAVLYINFAPYLGTVQAEHIWLCDEGIEFGLADDECAFYERPLRHLPTAVFEKPTGWFESWYEWGERLVDWFGVPGDEPTDWFDLLQRYFFSSYRTLNRSSG